jgi:ParB family chromosome partitioning protein
VDLIQRGKYQPRKDMEPESLQELADSIRAQGVMQPIVVRPVADSRYEIIAGERRWRATQLAGLDVIPALIRNVPDEAAIAMSLIENIQREDLNPIEEAVALQRLQQEFELTQQEVATAVGKSRSTVTNLLRLMTLQEDVRRMLEHGDLEMGHARALLGLDATDQSQAARTVVSRGLSVRQAEALVRRLLAAHDQPMEPPQLDPNIRQLQDDLSQRLGARVVITDNGKGKGKLVLSYNSLDELDGILSHIK